MKKRCSKMDDWKDTMLVVTGEFKSILKLMVKNVNEERRDETDPDYGFMERREAR